MESFLVQLRRLVHAGVTPCCDVRIIRIVAPRLALILKLHPKMPATRFVALQCVETKQLAEFEKVSDATRSLEVLVQVRRFARDLHVFPELFPQFWNELQSFFEALLRARHAALVPHDFTKFAMETRDGAVAIDREKSLRQFSNTC